MTPAPAAHPAAIRLMDATAPHLDTTAGLVRAVTAVALHVRPEAQPEDVERSLGDYAAAVLERIPRLATVERPITGRDAEILMAHLHQVLFEDAAFAGNSAAYYDERNSYLPDVLARRLGIPVTLGVVYKAVAERIGLRVHGIDAPVHFLLEVETGDASRRTFVDPFHGGRLLWEDEVRAVIGRATGTMPEDVRLERADHRSWVARVLRNLEAIFAEAGRDDDLRAMHELGAIARVLG